MKSRFHHNNILGIKSGDIFIEDVEGVKTLTFSQFKDRFQETSSNRSMLDDVSFNEISHEDRIFLEAPFSL